MLENKTCIPLLCIETVGVGPDPKSKRQFQIRTSSDVYTIKCNTELDWDLWIKSLIHATNLAKESSFISDISKKIEQVQFFLNEIANKNIICDQVYILEGKQQLRRALRLFEDNQARFGLCSSTGEPMAADFFPSLLKFLESFIDLKRAKHELKTNPSRFKERVDTATKALTPSLLQELESRRVIGQSVDEEISTAASLEETFQALNKVTNDTVYFLMRLSMSNAVFLEDYYSQLEEAALTALERVVV